MKYIIFVLTCFFINGCMFIGLNEDVKQIRESITIIGSIESGKSSTAPIIVTLSRPDEGEFSLQAYTVVYGSSEFLLSAPQGDYYLLAFEDSNQDFTLQENERVGWYGSPSLIISSPGQEYSGITIKLLDPGQAKVEIPNLFAPGTSHERVSTDDTNIGVVVDKTAFKPELGPLGMWEPVKFHTQGHSGIFFLEPYDKNKTPVLFVHGISGSGHDWLYMLDKLDREHFQPWIVQYPSGMRLDLLSKSLSQSVDELKAAYNVTDLIVVAHSMGGLVSRGFINHQLSADQGNNIITTFVTIATPWLGHNAASLGAKHAPVAVPSWFDMVPGSPYLRSLHQSPLPSNIKYYLLFSHKGKGVGLFNRSNTDGTVTLRSQLSMEAQEEAVKVLGYDEDHVSILNSADVAAKLNDILE